jgi:hypothetical protein
MRRLFFFLTLALAITAIITLELFVSCKNESGSTGQTASQQVRVQIEVIAGSGNSLQADLAVPVGTSARDLMERLFKMSYVDGSHKFVNGIAGFTASPQEKKYWRLEIDGKDSEVGIAEIKIDKTMRIRWVAEEIK